MKNEQNKVSVKWAAVVLAVLVIVIGGSIAALSLRPNESITDFESCKAAGGMIMESYPERCRIDDLTFVNEAQPEPVSPYEIDKYVGLTESEALSKAEEASIPARVVERDGEALPVTMDFVYGRYNLYVRDGEVYNLKVEGEASDGPTTAN